MCGVTLLLCLVSRKIWLIFLCTTEQETEHLSLGSRGQELLLAQLEDWSVCKCLVLGVMPELMRLFLQAYLHNDCSPKVIHRDIKASNILLDADFRAQVTHG